MKMRNQGKLWLVCTILLTISLFFAGCGGGGGGDSEADTPEATAPVIGIDKTKLTFTASSEGGANPDSQQLTVTNSGDTGSTLDWTISSDQEWLTFAPATGSLGKGDAATIKVTPDISGLLKGTHNAVITLTGTGLTSKTINVHLTIGAALAANPAEFSKSVAQGSNPPAQEVTLANASDLSVDWTATSDKDWLTFTPASGTLKSGGGSTPLQVSINSQNLPQGDYTGKITISSSTSGISNLEINVTLTITEPSAAAASVFIGGTATIGQTSGVETASASKAATGTTGTTAILSDAKVTTTVIKPDTSKSVYVTKTNAQGAYSAEVTAAKDDTITVLIEKDGFTSVNKTIKVKEGQTQYTVSGKVAQATIQVVKAENGVFKAGGGTGPGFRFGLMRSRSGEQVPFATSDGVRAAAGSSPDLDINIPASWAPNATALKTELASFNPNNKEERQMFPGEFVGVGGGTAGAAKADTAEYALESVSFFQADVAPNSGEPLTPTVATGASKAAGDGTLIYKYIPVEGCNAMKKYADRDESAPGVQVPIYTYNPNDGKWGYLGEGTLTTWDGLNYNTVPAESVIDDGGKLGNLACGPESPMVDYYFEIIASEWYTWWNLDYPILFAEPTIYTVTGRVVDQNGDPISGAFIEADGYIANGANNYHYTYAGNDGTFSLELALDGPEQLDRFEYAAYNYSAWATPPKSFTAAVTSGTGVERNVGDIIIDDGLGCSISGMILEEDGSPAPEETWVSLYTNDYSFYNWVYTDNAGLFTSKAPCNKPVSLQTWKDSFTVNVDGNVYGREESDDGAAVVIKDIIVANAAPDVYAWIGPNPVKAGQRVELSASAYDLDGDYPLIFAWTIQGANGVVKESDSDFFTWTPPSEGGYTVALTVTDSAGKATLVSETLTVNPDINTAPEIYWSWAEPASTCGGLPTLYAYAYDPDGDDIAYSFSAGDPVYNDLLGGWEPTTTVGSTVTVTATDNGSPAMSSSMDIAVPQSGDLTLEYAEVWPANTTVQSEVWLSAYTNIEVPITWSITAPDGSAVNLNFPNDPWTSFIPTQEGTYAVTLTASDGCGLPIERNFNVNVNPLSIAVSQAYVQYRTYEDPNNNRCQAWIEYTNDGQLMNEWDFYGVSFKDAAGNVLSYSQNFWYAEYLRAEWDSTTAQFGAVVTGGFSGWSFANFMTLDPGIYTFETEFAAGPVLSQAVDFPGATVLPVISSSTMQYQWNDDGSLTLSWTEPTEIFETYRLVLYAPDYYWYGSRDVFHGVVPSGVNSVTLSAALLQEIRNYVGLSSVQSFEWVMQTRNYDENNMNYARGISNRVMVDPPPGSVNVIIR